MTTKTRMTCEQPPTRQDRGSHANVGQVRRRGDQEAHGGRDGKTPDGSWAAALGPVAVADMLQGNIKFQVKWEGYDSKADLTWEPEENLVYVLSPPSMCPPGALQC